ncbi:hypothetical protein GYA54_03310 [Candidatus Kuenenbacteria bacterium]|nr:hypothetical protein [Candidatus Kuenenbacteria bacterium]
MAAQKIILVVAPSGFQDDEYRLTREELEHAHHDIVVASVKIDQAIGKFGSNISVDLALSDLNLDDCTALVFIGGPGAEIYKTDPVALDLVSRAMAKNKILGAICIAPLIFAHAGILDGKKATVWTDEGVNSTARELEQFGAIYTGEAVAIDGQIITADGPSSASAFGRAIVKALAVI